MSTNISDTLFYGTNYTVKLRRLPGQGMAIKILETNL